MPIGFLDRFDGALANDPRLAAAMRCLPAAAGTAGWPVAERAARAASNAAVRGALWPNFDSGFGKAVSG